LAWADCVLSWHWQKSLHVSVRCQLECMGLCQAQSAMPEPATTGLCPQCTKQYNDVAQLVHLATTVSHSSNQLPATIRLLFRRSDCMGGPYLHDDLLVICAVFAWSLFGYCVLSQNTGFLASSVAHAILLLACLTIQTSQSSAVVPKP
jgi:hypothetical protein